jgi:hypothetical protein
MMKRRQVGNKLKDGVEHFILTSASASLEVRAIEIARTQPILLVRFFVAFLAMLYGSTAMFLSLTRMLFGFVMITGFMVDCRSVMMFSSLVMPIGGLDMMLGSGML